MTMGNLLDRHSRMLLEQYRQQLQQLEVLERQVQQMLEKMLREQDITLNAFEHRIKTESSLIDKLQRKGQKYQDISQITDLVGFRLVTFFTDEVDRVAAFVSQLFRIDWKDSVDKRKSHSVNSFGYNSLHYICYLREGDLADIPFEIQMRTALQHVWSAIKHDFGYKGPMRLPAEYERQFGRLAGMLELVDDEFSRLRTTMNKYRQGLQQLVESGHLDEVPLNSETWEEYLQTNPFERLNQRIAAVNQAELVPVSLLPFCKILEDFGLETLGDVDTFISNNSEDAYQLAVAGLAVTGIDIISEYVGVQNLCLVHILKNGGGRKAIKAYYDAIYGEKDDNIHLADKIMRQAVKLPFME